MWKNRSGHVRIMELSVALLTSVSASVSKSNSMLYARFETDRDLENNKELEKRRTKPAPANIDSELQLITAEALYKSTGAIGKASSK